MSFVSVDHLIVAANTLAEGVRWCEDTLGVTPGPGGEHPFMGTHNRLLKIANASFPQAYLEIMSIDPAAKAPARSRWFGLDTLDLRAGPRLIHVVGRSPMLDMHRWGLITVGLQPGDPIEGGRDTPQGPLAWQILVREDGQLNCGGALPTLIQWDGPHPTDAMPDSGLSLKSLTLNGVPDRAREVLRMRGVSVSAQAGPALRASFETPRGEVTVQST